jgi:tetratricopeptide (TPR) repeat protein
MNIVFLGNCHTFELVGLVHRALHENPDLTCRFFLRVESEETVSATRTADRIICHVTDYEPDDAIKEIVDAAGERVIRLPYIAGNFLWPLATRQHPRNREAVSYFRGSGPYEPQFSDAQLIKLMEAHADEPAEDIVDRFLELDINAIQPLDRFYEFNRHKYTRVGESCGLNLWPLMERHLTDQRPFYTCFHPSDLLMKAVGRFTLEWLGVPDTKITETLQGFDPFLGGQMPIHPSVIRHFGLHAVDENTRYVYFPEGHFTAREYFIRFVKFSYDAELHKAVHDFQVSGKTAEALPVITDRLEQRPDNPDLWNQLAYAYRRLERRTEAACCAMRAMALEPTRHEFQLAFRHLVDPARLGIAEWPSLPTGETLSFGTPGSPALAGLRGGWSHPEAWGVWGLGGELRLTYLLNGLSRIAEDEFVTVDFECWPAVYDPDHELCVDVFTEEQLITQWRFDEADTRAPSISRRIAACPIRRVNGDPVLSLLFRVTGFASPAALGLSGDERNLSLGLKSIAVHPIATAVKDLTNESIANGENAPTPHGHLVSAPGQPELEAARSTVQARLRQLWRLGGGLVEPGRTAAGRRAVVP